MLTFSELEGVLAAGIVLLPGRSACGETKTKPPVSKPTTSTSSSFVSSLPHPSTFDLDEKFPVPGAFRDDSQLDQDSLLHPDDFIMGDDEDRRGLPVTGGPVHQEEPVQNEDIAGKHENAATEDDAQKRDNAANDDSAENHDFAEGHDDTANDDIAVKDNAANDEKAPESNSPTTTLQPEQNDSLLSTLPPPPERDDSSLIPFSDDGDRAYENQTLMEENEMRQKLMDMESSFLPEPPPLDTPRKHPGDPTDDFTPAAGRTMALKEQSNTIDRLSKENFDLKMKIHFLLNKPTEESMRDEYVELKSDQLKMHKDNHGLRRKVRELEKRLKDHQSDKESMASHDSERDEEMHWLRERVDTYELEIEKLRSKSISRETELVLKQENSDLRKVHREDMDQAEEEIRNLRQERDQALRMTDQTGMDQVEEELQDLRQERDQALRMVNQEDMGQVEEEMQKLRQERDQALRMANRVDVEQVEEQMQNLRQERDQAVQMADERDAAYQELVAEAQEEIDTLGDELDEKFDECQRLGEECQRLEQEISHQDGNIQHLEGVVHSAKEGILRLEEDSQANLEKYKTVQRELEDSKWEMESLERSLFEANTKAEELTVQIKSGQDEIACLREERDSDKTRIRDLETETDADKMSLHTEQEKARDLENRLVDEQRQREVITSKEKHEIQRRMKELNGLEDLNREASAAKEEARRLKENLSTQKIETGIWRERLMDLENNLRGTLGDLSGSRDSLISNIIKLQQELEKTALDLAGSRSQLSEKESLLRTRDSLLESLGLESRKLAELLDRERHGRRTDKQSFEQALRKQHQPSRPMTQETFLYRLRELEKKLKTEREARLADREGARQRITERDSENQKLRERLSRDRLRRAITPEEGRDDGTSSEEGLCVDIEV